MINECQKKITIIRNAITRIDRLLILGRKTRVSADSTLAARKIARLFLTLDRASRQLDRSAKRFEQVGKGLSRPAKPRRNSQSEE